MYLAELIHKPGAISGTSKPLFYEVAFSTRFVYPQPDIESSGFPFPFFPGSPVGACSAKASIAVYCDNLETLRRYCGKSALLRVR